MDEFEYDVFLSYAHLDNASFGGVVENWIDCLFVRLNSRLTQLLGRPARIWRDVNKLGGNEVFDETIAAELSKAATMLMVVTPRYLQSQSCREELDHFRGGELRVGRLHRVFQVVKTPVPVQERPFPEVLGYEFFAEDEHGRLREYNYEQGPGKDPRYWNRLEDLASDILQTLNAMAAAGFRRAPAGSEVAPISGSATAEPTVPEKAVYLAETTSDLTDERDSVRRELEQHGYFILPGENLPRDLTRDEIAERVNGHLGSARLSIHLFGARQGFIPEGGSEPIVRLQHDLARKLYAGTGTKRVLWVPNGLEDAAATEAGQREFLKALLADGEALTGAELLRNGIDDLKTYICELLRPPRAPEPVAAPDSPPIVYLLYDRSDYEETEMLESFLFEQRCEVFSPALTESDQSKAYTLHQDNLKLCDALLIYFNRAGETWLKMKQQELIKLPGLGRSKPLRAKAFVIRGTADAYKERFRSNQARVIRQPDDRFAPELLQDFMADLRLSGGGPT